MTLDIVRSLQRIDFSQRASYITALGATELDEKTRAIAAQIFDALTQDSCRAFFAIELLCKLRPDLHEEDIRSLVHRNFFAFDEFETLQGLRHLPFEACSKVIRTATHLIGVCRSRVDNARFTLTAIHTDTKSSLDRISPRIDWDFPLKSSKVHLQKTLRGILLVYPGDNVVHFLRPIDGHNMGHIRLPGEYLASHVTPQGYYYILARKDDEKILLGGRITSAGMMHGFSMKNFQGKIFPLGENLGLVTHRKMIFMINNKGEMESLAHCHYCSAKHDQLYLLSSNTLSVRSLALGAKDERVLFNNLQLMMERKIVGIFDDDTVVIRDGGRLLLLKEGVGIQTHLIPSTHFITYIAKDHLYTWDPDDQRLREHSLLGYHTWGRLPGSQTLRLGPKDDRGWLCYRNETY